VIGEIVSEKLDHVLAASSHPHLPVAPQLPGLRDYSSGPCPERPIAKSLASPGLQRQRRGPVGRHRIT
jgi:hypothetical protein